jgi:penicillin-binding protein-related factor A (putative recombinase)
MRVQQLWGRIVESAVGTHFLTYQEEGFEIQYYNEGNNEVDYIILYKGKTIALEIKTSKQPAKGLQKFEAKFAPHRSYLISPQGLSWQQLIRLHPSELF